MAGAADFDPLLALIGMSDDEWMLGPPDNDEVRHTVGLATAGGPQPRPTFMVIGATSLQAAVGLYPTKRWNSKSLYLRGFYHFVHPAYRKSTHGKDLMRFAEWFSDESKMPLIWELLHPEKTEAKARLYGRRAVPVGSLYLYGEMAS